MSDDFNQSEITTSDLDSFCDRLRTGDNGKNKTSRVGKKQLADFKRDTDQVNTLIQGGWAKRGCISMHVSTTGTGKSVLQTQSSLSFHQGIECCGLKPTRPFKMWIVQSEDDDDRIAFDRDCIVERLAKDHPDADWNQAMKDILFLDFTGITGPEFIKELDNELHHCTAKPDGIIINPAAYTHTSVAILDAVKAVGIPTVEVHMSDVKSRDEFRQVSYIRQACIATVMGKGFGSYIEALELLAKKQR